MAEPEFQEFDTQGLDIDPSLALRYRFGVVGEKPIVYPPCIPLDFSFQRNPGALREHVRYGRFWERPEEPTDEDRAVLMDWAKQRLAADIAAALEHDPPAPDDRHYMRRGA